MKFKVGDRVRVVRESLSHSAKVGMTGLIVVKTGECFGVRFDNAFAGGHSLDGRCEKGHGQWMIGEDLELIGDNHKIVITSDGKTTLARLYEGKKVVKSAEANCSPDDEFDFTQGAKIAFERLTNTFYVEPKYYSGKLVCVESDCDWWTAGKVYEIVNGEMFDDTNDKRFGILDVPNFNKVMHGFAKFIELKE